MPFLDKSYAWNFCKKKKVIYTEENFTHTPTPHHGVYTFVPAVCYWKSTEHVKIASTQALSKNAYQSVRTLLVMFGEIRSNNEPWDWTWFLVNICTHGYDTKDIFQKFCLIVYSILSKDSFKFWWQAITQEKRSFIWDHPLAKRGFKLVKVIDNTKERYSLKKKITSSPWF